MDRAAGVISTMDSLNLPLAKLKTRDECGKTQVYDAIRGVYTALTEEEWVRQHFVQYLVDAKRVPRGLVAIEKGFEFQGMLRRADIVVYSREAKPWLVVECKAPAVALTQKAFDQIGRYNRVLGARFVGVTNGINHYCFTVDDTGIHFLDSFPDYYTNQ